MDLTIFQARLANNDRMVNIGIENGKIVSIREEDIPSGRQTIDAQGAMLSPAFVDPHFHLENALLNETANQSGTLQEAIQIYAAIKRDMSKSNIMERASRALRLAAANGTLWMRNHVDIDQVAKLRLLEAICEVRSEFTGIIDIQIIAFPQLGLAKNPEAVDLMWQAMEKGANVVGGMPHGEHDLADAARHIEIAFEIACARKADIDMHIDETDDPYWTTLELLADKTIEMGYQGKVTAGHCCAMAGWDDRTAARVIEKVRKAEINVVTNSPVNLLLQGRHDSQPVRRGITRVKELLEAGVNVACGQDDLMNMFYPFGCMDMLEVANFVAHAAHLSSQEHMQAAFDMPRSHAARVMHIANYGIYEGADANLVLIPASSAADALARHPIRTHVIRHGQILVQNRFETIFNPQVLA
ncbi:MAG: amidohydrolase family protein [Anaerolineaceae bacterium]|nr:amidohydrolase family protein [Anaerolineaceae bacterium]